jgi:ABC-type amino acid transport substrate-binding protein
MEVQQDFKDLLALLNKNKVDYILTSITGVSWEQVETGSIEGRFGEVKVRYIGRNEFIANKRALGRKKDLADLEAVGEE